MTSTILLDAATEVGASDSIATGGAGGVLIHAFAGGDSPLAAVEIQQSLDDTNWSTIASYATVSDAGRFFLIPRAPHTRANVTRLGEGGTITILASTVEVPVTFADNPAAPAASGSVSFGTISLVDTNVDVVAETPSDSLSISSDGSVDIAATEGPGFSIASFIKVKKLPILAADVAGLGEVSSGQLQLMTLPAGANVLSTVLSITDAETTAFDTLVMSIGTAGEGYDQLMSAKTLLASADFSSANNIVAGPPTPVYANIICTGTEVYLDDVAALVCYVAITYVDVASVSETSLP